MIELDDEQQAARDGFEALRDRFCARFEAIERKAGSDAVFERIAWERKDGEAGGREGLGGGGGVRATMKGAVFEKVGVNVSTVGGRFSPEFAANIHGAAEDPRFFATGISLVAHMANPHVPAVHMNLRFLATTRRWFGGAADLNPPIPDAADVAQFHARLRAACAAHDQTFYERFKAWADEYFFIPHRNVARGAGGIFFDHLEVPFAAGFAFARAVGEAVLDIFPEIVERRMDQAWDEAERARMLAWRGRYAEFNLLYDRGTAFGLKTGGDVDAILMSLPPEARWP